MQFNTSFCFCVNLLYRTKTHVLRGCCRHTDEGCRTCIVRVQKKGIVTTLCGNVAGTGHQICDHKTVSLPRASLPVLAYTRCYAVEEKQFRKNRFAKIVEPFDICTVKIKPAVRCMCVCACIRAPELIIMILEVLKIFIK